jgi:uncharacterized protein YggT (Ycf19 family)
MKRQINKLNQGGYGLIAGILSFIFGVIITLLAFRLLFRLLSANPGNEIVNWVYQMSEPFVRPFFGMFNTTVDVATGRFEIETLIAIVVYGVVAALVTGIFGGRRTI